MQESLLLDLLREIRDASYRHPIGKPKCTVGYLSGYLSEKHYPLDLIIELFAGDLIRDANDPKQSKTYDRTIDKEIPCILTITGFQYLNQMEIKKTIMDLNETIEKFNESSNKAYNQLNDSIRQFNESSDKYSKELVDLTRSINVFTIIVVALPIYEKILQRNYYEAILLSISVVFIAAFMLIFFYFKDPKKREQLMFFLFGRSS